MMTYDNGGNLTSKKENNNTINYSYDDNWKDLLISYNGQQIIYDGAGNPTLYKGSTLAWQNGRQLASYGSNTYDYDYSGIRTRKNGTYYLVEGSRVIAEQTGNSLILYYYDESGVCGMRYNNADYYFEKNILGDIIGIYNTSGTLIGSYTYDAWGKILTQTDNAVTNANPFRYRGYYYDSETKLYYLNSRYYDPEQVALSMRTNRQCCIIRQGQTAAQTCLRTASTIL